MQEEETRLSSPPNQYLEDLRMMVQSYLDTHKSLSVNALAKRSGISTSSLRRLIVNKQKSEIAPHLVLNLISYIAREKNFKQLIDNIPQSLSEYLLKHFGSFLLQETNNKIDFDLNEVLSDQIKYFIYKMASHKLGTTDYEVNLSYGQLGLKKLKEMLSSGLVYQDEEKIRAKEENFSIDLERLSQLLPYIVSYYRPDQLERGLNLCYNLSESLNEAAIKEIKQLKKDTISKIYQIMIDPNSWGEHHYMCVLFGESMTSYQTGE